MSTRRIILAIAFIAAATMLVIGLCTVSSVEAAGPEPQATVAPPTPDRLTS